MFFFFVFELTRHAASTRPPCLIYLSTSTGVHTRVPLFNWFVCLSVCLSVCLCVTFAVFTHCESCTRPISTNPVFMEAGEYGLTRETCFVARRLGVAGVAGLLWVSWCVLGGADFFMFFFRFYFFFERTRPAAIMRPPCLIYLSTSIIGDWLSFYQ